MSTTRTLLGSAFHRVAFCPPLYHRFSNSKFSTSTTSTSPSTPTVYDVCVIGGGGAGAALACALPKSLSLRTLLLDGATLPTLILSEGTLSPSPSPVPAAVSVLKPSPRVLAISPATVSLLQKCGVWYALLATGRVRAYKHMRVWDASGSGMLAFDSDETSQRNRTSSSTSSSIEASSTTSETTTSESSRVDALGYVVENLLINAALADSARLRDDIEVRENVHVSSVQLPGQHSDSSHALPCSKVTLHDGSVIYARLLVGADGANSFVRSAAGIETIGWAYNQSAVVATLRMSKEHETAFQRFLPTGPIALLPSFGEYSSLVWSTNPAHAAQLGKLAPDDFLHEVETAFTSSSISFSPIKELEKQFSRFSPFPPSPQPIPPPFVALEAGPFSFPLKLNHATSYVQDGMALIGDAAHQIHPLAGQGANLGFQDAELLASTIERAVATGHSPGNLTLLREYERERKLANLAALATVDTIKYTFESQFGPFVAARNAALSFVNAASPLKRLFARAAQHGTLPWQSISSML
mmetsp:Transcript_45323/g.114102  ORF Transcript_45323/g.114102 Transcript_45323/m.114102 type:complete len:528 (-) Transcript_45323:107-1690(-)